MKKVPFYFFLDLTILGVRKRAEVINWFKKVKDLNPDHTMYYISDIGSSKYLGFIKESQTLTRNYPVSSGYSSDYNDYDSKKVTYEYWKKNIKDVKLSVLALKDTYKIPTSDNLKVVKRTRNQVCEYNHSNASGVKKLIREAGLTKKLTHKNAISTCSAVNAGDGVGIFLKGAMGLRAFSFNNGNNYIPYILRSHFIKMGVFKKCLRTNEYWSSRYIYDVIKEDGSTLQMYHNISSAPRSSRDTLYFESRVAATNYGYARCDVTNDWLPQHEACTTPNARYHSLQRKFMKEGFKGARIGFEIEKEDAEAHKIGYQKLYNETSWCKESDSSLDSCTGYELISPVYPLFSKMLDKDIKNNEDLQTLINGSYSSKCGGHINISSDVYTPIQLLHGMRGYLPLMYAIWNLRLDNRYSGAKKVGEYRNGDRSAMNVKANVLEIRLASGVKSVKNLLWRRDLVKLMMEHINKSELEVLRMMLNPNSRLHKHLRKVYNAKNFMKKCNMFVKYSQQFNDVLLEDIDWDSIDKAKRDDINPSVEED